MSEEPSTGSTEIDKGELVHATQRRAVRERYGDIVTGGVSTEPSRDVGSCKPDGIADSADERDLSTFVQSARIMARKPGD